MTAKYNRIAGEGSVIITDHELQARPREKDKDKATWQSEGPGSW